MLTVDHLLCYGKRLAARRLGLGEVHDREPALRPQPVDLATLAFWSEALEPFPSG